MPVLNLRKATAAPPPPQSEARAKLADRIRQRDAVRAVIGRLDGISPWEEIDAAEGDVTRARAVLVQAETAAREHRILKLIGEATGDGPDVPAARAALSAAEACLTEAQETARDLQGRLAEARADLPRREEYTRDAARKVLVEESAGLVQALHREVAELQVAYVAKVRALALLVQDLPAFGAPRDAAALSAARELNTYAGGWRCYNTPAATVLVDQINATLAALCDDAAAPVPGTL